MDYGFTSSTSTGDPHERRGWLPAYSLVFQVISTSFLALRLASRFQKRGGRLGLDDLFVVLGWVSTVPAAFPERFGQEYNMINQIFATGSTILFIVGRSHPNIITIFLRSLSLGAFHFGFDRHSAGYTAKLAMKSTLVRRDIPFRDTQL